MKSAEIKRYLKGLGVTARVRSGTGKGHWIGAWVPCNKSNLHTLTYSLPPFPLDFSQKCLRIIYGADCSFADGGNAGNVRPYDVSMSEAEWSIVMAP